MTERERLIHAVAFATTREVEQVVAFPRKRRALMFFDVFQRLKQGWSDGIRKCRVSRGETKAPEEAKMGQGRQEQGFEGLSMKDSFNLLNLACNALGACVVPFLRTGFGKNYPGVAALLGLIAMLLYAAFGQVPDMFTYIGVWLVVILIQRARTFSDARKGKVVHSRYWGDSLFAHFVRKETTARSLELVICFLAGGVLCSWSPGVGGFVMVAGVGNVLATAIVVEADRKRLEAMRDAEIEQRHLAARYRGESEEP